MRDLTLLDDLYPQTSVIYFPDEEDFGGDEEDDDE